MPNLPNRNDGLRKLLRAQESTLLDDTTGLTSEDMNSFIRQKKTPKQLRDNVKSAKPSLTPAQIGEALKLMDAEDCTFAEAKHKVIKAAAEYKSVSQRMNDALRAGRGVTLEEGEE